MFRVGLTPTAELGGVLALIGAALLVPVLADTVATILSVLALGRGRPWASGLLRVPAAVDLTIGVLLMIGVTRSGTPLRSPLLVRLVPLVLGAATLVVTPRARAGRRAETVQFSRELRPEVLSGDITVSFRLWRVPKVKPGGRYPVGSGWIEVDAVEVIPFGVIDEDDVRRSGETDREALRRRAAHAGPIHDDTLLYRIEFHVVEVGQPI